MTVTITRPLPNVATTTKTRPKLARVTDDTTAPPRIVLNAVEGFGKSTFGANAPNPAVLMSRGETGYITLRKAGLVPDVDCVELLTWADVLGTVDDIADENSPHHGAVVLDALGGFERLCHEFVCARDFNNDWGDRGFSSYMRGYDVSVAEWIILLTKLDRVRANQNIPIVLLSHSKIRPFKNPLGSDFDRYVADCHEKTWGVTHKWADAVLFGNFVTVPIEDRKTKRAKGIGGDERVIYTTRRDAYDAKNRYGLPRQISLTADPAASWSTVMGLVHGGSKQAAAAEQSPDL